jgi:hypothetical protein
MVFLLFEFLLFSPTGLASEVASDTNVPDNGKRLIHDHDFRAEVVFYRADGGTTLPIFTLVSQAESAPKRNASVLSGNLL